MGRRNTRGEMVSFVPLEDLANDRYIRPAWLQSAYDAPEWSVTSGRKGKDNITINFAELMPDGSLLTDDDHAHLLKTVKYIVFHARMGSAGVPYTNNGEGQRKLARNLVNMARWMNLNGINRFSRVTKADFREFKSAYAMGWAAALQYPARFEKLVKSYQDEGRQFPTKKNGNSRKLSLDLTALLGEAGMLANVWRTDPVCAFVGQRFAHQQGLYVRKPIADFNDPSAKPTDPKTSTVDTLTKTFGHINALYTVSLAEEYLDIFKADPFEGTNLSREAELIGRRNGQTGTIPAHLALTLMDRSIRWVVDYGPELLRLRDKAEKKWGLDSETIDDPSQVSSGVGEMITKHQPETDGPGAPWPLRGFRRNQDMGGRRKFTPQQMSEIKEALKTDSYREIAARYGIGHGALHNAVKAYGEETSVADSLNRPSLHIAVNHYLPMACAIVILSQTARREGEVASLRADCLDTDAQQITFSVVDEDGALTQSQAPSIEQEVEKTLQSWDVFPTNEIVVKSVELLTEWSAPAREITGRPALFQYKVLGEDSVSRFTTNGPIKTFPAFVDADTDERGDKWEFSDHQFRRFFALIYFWRYEGSNLTALSQYLRHYDIEMTMEYIKETIGGDEFDEAHRAKLYELIMGGLKGEIKLIGPFAESINRTRKKLIARARNTLKAITPDQWVKRANRLVDKSGLVLRIAGSGSACFGESRSRRHLALCKGVDSKPNRELASPGLCRGCPNWMGWDALEPNLRQQERNADEVLASDKASPILKARAENDKRDAQEGLRALEVDI